MKSGARRYEAATPRAGLVLVGLLAACQATNTPAVITQAEQTLADSQRQLRREVDRRKESFGAIGAALTGCSLERRKAYELDAEQESTLGQAVAARQLALLGVEPLPATDPVAHYVEQVGQYLALVAAAVGTANAPDRTDRPEGTLDNRPWPQTGFRFLVLPLDEPRATGGPGGTVMISTGFLRSLESEEELAAVLAHEVAHVQRGHGVEALKATMCQYDARQESSDPLAALGRLLKLQRQTPGSGPRSMKERVPRDLLGGAAEEAANLYREGFPRDFELEADRISVRITLAAGYDARAFAAVLRRISRESPARHAWLRMHPPPSERLPVVGQRLVALGSARVFPTAEAVAPRTARFIEAMAPLKASEPMAAPTEPGASP